MPRTIIDIPDDQLREVDNLCKLLAISRAEAVRRALNEFVRDNGAVKTDGFGLWKDTAVEPVPDRPSAGRGHVTGA